MIRGLDSLDLTDRTVIVRADLNVPLSDTGEVVDDGRIRASLPTIAALREAGARIVVLSHLGRPRGERVAALSLAPVADRLGGLLDVEVGFCPDPGGPVLARMAADLAPGGIVVAENVRFDARETSKDAAERRELAQEWADIGDAFVSDGFGVVHREQASVTDLADLLPAAAGLLVAAELDAFHRVLVDPGRPYAVLLGGAKVSDKIAVIEHLIDRVDRILIGGGMAFTFIRAQGGDIGASLCEESMLETCGRIVERARSTGVELVLPVDAVIAEQVSADAPTRIVAADAIPAGWMGLDIGPDSIEVFRSALADAATIVWNGPMGVFELAPFASGTRALAETLAASPAFTVVGGGDSAAAIRLLGIPEERIGHISTGGGASLELLEGRTLPGIAVLEEGR